MVERAPVQGQRWQLLNAATAAPPISETASTPSGLAHSNGRCFSCFASRWLMSPPLSSPDHRPEGPGQ